MNRFKNLMTAFGRKRFIEEDDDGQTKLARVLNVFDLTALGVGSTLGLGVYVLAGSVAKQQAGPAVVLSFLIAAVASGFAAVCYAEFAARVPKAGSAYVYSYVSVGELIAYVIGWNLILEYIIGTASVSRGLSSYIDALVNNTMKEALSEAMPIKVDFLSDYPDFLAVGIILLLTVLLSFGVKESSTVNNVLTVLNIITILIVIIGGAIKSQPDNWKIKAENIPPEEDGGVGGFLPFGFAGVMAGAAKCFYGFVGFDCVATTGEEAKNPERNIPLSIILSLLIIFLSYFGTSTVLTMMWPYYAQDLNAPFPFVFDQVGWTVVKWIVTIGAVFALTTSLMGSMFPLPRIFYAMAHDGLIFKFMAKIHPRTQTPMIATLVSGVLAGIMAVIFDLQQLIEMLSIGTLLAYTIVAICILLLRYQEDEKYPGLEREDQETYNNKQEILSSPTSVISILFNLRGIKYPYSTTANIVKWTTIIFCLFTIGFDGILAFGNPSEPYGIVLLCVFGIFMIISWVIIGRQPNSSLQLFFKVPLVPLVPGLSILVNIYLMLMLDVYTWVRFGVWMAIGFFVYFVYGIRHSSANVTADINRSVQ